MSHHPDLTESALASARARVWRFPVGHSCRRFRYIAFSASSLSTAPRLAASFFEGDDGTHVVAIGHASVSAAAPTRATTWAINMFAVVSRCWAYFERINTRKTGKRAQHGDSGLHRRQVLLVHGRDRRMRVIRAEARAKSTCVCRAPCR